MEEFLSKEIQAGLDAARMASLRKGARLWKTGFSVDAADAPKLRGLVDLYDGSLHLFQCLIVASEEEAGEMRYEFKRATAVADRPPLDFERPADAPLGLIEDGRA